MIKHKVIKTKDYSMLFVGFTLWTFFMGAFHFVLGLLVWSVAGKYKELGLAIIIILFAYTYFYAYGKGMFKVEEKKEVIHTC